MAQITYINKSFINENPDVAAQNKVSAADMNEIKTVVNQNDTLLSNITGNILWTNPNPTANFSEQYINLSSSDYDVLEWYCRSDTSIPRMLTVKCLKGYGGQADMFSTGAATRRWCRRWVAISNTQYAVYHCFQLEQGESQITANDQCVPLYVVGYKTGLF